jgi:hypothetical protein
MGAAARPLSGAAAAALSLAVLLLAGSKALAAELVYWDNFRDEPATIAYANVDGSGGGALNLDGVEIRFPEGMAYDPVANRLYVANEGPAMSEGEIAYVNLDGSGGGVFSAPKAPVRSPEGIALDPVRRTVYWANSADETISWAKLDGSDGGLLNTDGARTEGLYRLALDRVGGRLYWSGSNGAERFLSYAKLDGSGGGVLPVAPPGPVNGLAADPTTGRLYWLDSETGTESLYYTALSGAGGISGVPLATADQAGTGLAVDPLLGKAYWGNYGLAGTPIDAIGFASLGGATGTISPATAPVNGAQDPVIIRSPSGTGAPTLYQAKAYLSCSQGGWASDYPGSNVFQSPRSYAYRWTLNGTPIAAASAPIYTATAAGIYGCIVTATNQAGSTSQGSSTAATVTAASFELSVRKRKARAGPGKLATFRVQALNQGDLDSAAARLCLKVPRMAKRDLRAPKCKRLKPVAAGATAFANLRLRVKPAAAGGYRLKITLSGTKATKVGLKVVG